MKAIIVGAGTYGQVYLSYLREGDEWDIVGFLDDNEAKVGQPYCGLPVLGTTQELRALSARGISAVFAPIGDNRSRVRVLTDARDLGLLVPTFLHHTAIVSRDAILGQGVYVLPGSIIMPLVVLEDFVMIGVGAKIAHHTRLGRGVCVSTGTNVGASIEVGDRVLFGIGCTVMTGVHRIGVGAVLGAGTVVIRDVEDGETIVGVPGKPLRKS